MVTAIIYRQYKTSTQAGKSKTKKWIMEFQNPDSFSKEAVMGWNSVDATHYQMNLFFDTCDDALFYADQHKINVTVTHVAETIQKPKSYADNFRAED